MNEYMFYKSFDYDLHTPEGIVEFLMDMDDQEEGNHTIRQAAEILDTEEIERLSSLIGNSWLSEGNIDGGKLRQSCYDLFDRICDEIQAKKAANDLGYH